MADLNKYVGGGGRSVKLHDQRERIREASEDELQDLLTDAEGELLGLRTQAMLHQTPNPMRIRHVRKMIARIQTELTARRNKVA
ncbi:MAG: 50S ribosomal protein L29 [Armatimonadota bacterium]|nr:50S ribosomal protein L29 [Armatimonadota bacterium]